MISEAKLEANRVNAEKSTGPVTPEGKSNSSMNALKHGLRARKAILLPNETEEDYMVVRKAMLYDLDPRGMAECIIADIVIDSAWRLRRIPTFETQVLAYSQNRINKRHPDWEKEFPQGPHSQERAEWGRVWQFSETSLVNVRRYENALTHTFFRGLSELRNAAKNRVGLACYMPHHPEIADDFPAESACPPPAYYAVLESGMSAPPVAPAPAERTDPGHDHNPPAHNSISPNELPDAVGSFGKQTTPADGTATSPAVQEGGKA